MLGLKRMHVGALVTAIFAFTATGNPSDAQHSIVDYIDQDQYHDTLPFSTRAYWMRFANAVNYDLSPCPRMPFGAVIVNHTTSFSNTSDIGDLICTGLNHNNRTGNPTLDGEMAAIANCSFILTDPNGRFKLSPEESVAAYSDFSIYTNGEPCPMCASAISWTGFREMIYGTSIATLIEHGWPQIRIESRQVFQASWDIRRTRTVLVGSVLANETDPWFAWQFDEGADCPAGCERSSEEGCLPIEVSTGGKGEL